MKIHELLSPQERKDHPAFTDEELVQFLWTVREGSSLLGVKRTNLLRFFTTLAEAQER